MNPPSRTLRRFNGILLLAVILTVPAVLASGRISARAQYDRYKGCGIRRLPGGDFQYSPLRIDRRGYFTDSAGSCVVHLKGFNVGRESFGDAVGDATEEDTAFLDRSYRMNFARLTIQVRWYNDDVFVPAAHLRYRELVKRHVAWLTARGMYVLIAKGPSFYAPPCGGENADCPYQNHGKQETQLDARGGDMHFSVQAERFFEKIVPVFAAQDNVLYDVWNEPHAAGELDLWYRTTQKLIDTVRRGKPSALVAVEGPDAAGGGTMEALGALQKDFEGDNLFYTLHIYDGFNGVSPGTGRKCSEPNVYPWPGPAYENSFAAWAHGRGRGFGITEWGGCYDYNTPTPYNDDITRIGREQDAALAYYQAIDTYGNEDLNENGKRVAEGYARE